MSVDPRIIAQQRSELTEHHIYARLAERAEGENRRILAQVAAEELGHHAIWQSITGVRVEPQRWRVVWYVLLARLFGLAFALKLMEGGESRAQHFYREMAARYPQVAAIGDDEKRHEKALVTLLADERLAYAGAIVLGLNDALVELTGTLAGLTLAFENARLIAYTGLVMGVAAALSMASSGYFAAQEGADDGIDPLKSAINTGVAYIITVAMLVTPYFLFATVLPALVVMLLLTVLIIAGYTFYISVSKEVPFASRFTKMAAVSIAVAAISFGIGWALKQVLGVDV